MKCYHPTTYDLLADSHIFWLGEIITSFCCSMELTMLGRMQYTDNSCTVVPKPTYFEIEFAIDK
jgi:hypothetical protein